MFEKRWAAVPPQLFIADGAANGTVKVTAVACKLFKVKQKVIISAATLPNLDQIEIKKILDDNTIIIGPQSANIHTYTDLSAYTTALGAFIFANEQHRSSIPFEEVNRATYEEEPTVAERVILVDECGDKYNDTNRLPVEATVNLTASKPNTHTIFNKLVATAATEVSVLLPDKTEIITIMVRSNKASKLQYSFVSGESGTKFITVMPGVRKEISNIGLSGLTPLYFQLSLVESGGTIVEIETWNS